MSTKEQIERYIKSIPNIKLRDLPTESDKMIYATSDFSLIMRYLTSDEPCKHKIAIQIKSDMESADALDKNGPGWIKNVAVAEVPGGNSWKPGQIKKALLANVGGYGKLVSENSSFGVWCLEEFSSQKALEKHKKSCRHSPLHAYEAMHGIYR